MRRALGAAALLVLVSLILAAPASAQASALAAAYSFDEGSGSAAADASGNANTATLQGATWTSEGRFGGALLLNGASGLAMVADSASLDLTSAMTVEAWVYPTLAPSGWRTVVYKETDVFYLEAGSSQGTPAAGGTFVSGNRNVFAPAPLSVNAWTHLAMTYDGAALRLFVNGLQVASEAQSGSLVASASPLCIGGNTAYGEHFAGRIDEVRVYGRALTHAEIQSDMSAPVGGPSGPNSPMLILAGPEVDSTRVGTAVPVTYTTTGDLTEVNHVHFQIDANPQVMDLSFDGSYTLSGVHVGDHLLQGWLVRADHSKIAGTDATPVAFTTVADPSDPVAPGSAMTAPGNGATVSGTVALVASASDNVGVYGVLFTLDGASIGTEDRTAPYSLDWVTTSAANGSHTLRAVARDVAGNETTSAAVAVTVSNVASTDPAVIGQWAGPTTWPLVSVHASLLPTGRVLLYDDHTNSPGVQVWDPATGSLTPKPYNTNNLFCSGHAELADGRVLVVGGHLGVYAGINDVTLFDPVTESWSPAGSMAYARWYPTATTLSDGRVLAVSGAIDCPTCGSPNGSHSGIALIPEVYDPSTNAWSQLPGASLSLPLYPHMFLLPDGRVLAAGTAEDPIVSRVLNLSTQSWAVVDPVVRDGGSSVMYVPGKILKSGSARNPDYPSAAAAATAYVIDMNQPGPTWRAVTSMAFPRTQHNLTSLPDGSVLAIGGAGNSDVYDVGASIYEAELWSPVTESWSTLAPMQEPRLYHSTVVLLPDGRVMVAGGGRFGPDFPSAEIYSPPYLFRGARPVIGSAPALIQYGAHFSVQTPDAGRIGKVTLLRLASVTHAFDQNARFLELSFQQVGGALDVQAPATANLAPPGYYMLFLVDTSGIPSIASMVRLPIPGEDSVPPSAPGGLNATGSIGRIDLSWSPATDNVGVTGYNIHRASAPGIVPTLANRIGQSTSTAYADMGLAAGTYYYVVTAQDARGNVGPPSNEDGAAAQADTTNPSVTMTAPGAGSTVSGSVTVSANASDNVGVVGVQFLLDGADLGSEDTATPYSITWNSSLVANGQHLLSARARDAAGNSTTTPARTVTVSNAAPGGLAAAYSFDEGSGGTAADSSGHANTGSVHGAVWTAYGRHGGALSFDGASDYVEAPSSPSLDISGSQITIEMWVNITDSAGPDYALLTKPWAQGSQPYPYYQYGVEFDANGAKTLDFYFGDGAGGLQGPFSMVPLLGVWTHLAFTYDGTTVRGYLDGVLKVSAAATQSLQARGVSLRVGVDSVYTQGFKGRIDDVRIYARWLGQSEVQQDMNAPVTSPGSLVPPVPDGTFGTPMTADRVNTAGTSIDLNWNVTSCPATGYHLLYGPLSGVGSYTLSGSACGLGTSGAHNWTGVPAGSLWYVVVGDNAAGLEGTWGTRSSGAHRAGATPSGMCGNTTRNNTALCP